MSNAPESSSLSAILLVVTVLACVAAAVAILLDVLGALAVAGHCLLPYCPIVIP